MMHNLYRPISQFDKFARTKILLPELNCVDAGVSRRRDSLEQQAKCFVVVSRKLAARGYVIEKQSSSLTNMGSLPCNAGVHSGLF